jgi:hypothetical protein
MSEPQQATPPEELRRQIMDYNEPKNEREWWACNRIHALEKQMPAILEYLESQADVVDSDNGIPHPNKAMTLLVWLRHEVEKKDEQ